MKLSKQKSKLHDEAESLVKLRRPLTDDEKIFILDNWNPMTSHNVGKTGTFFTPFLLAKDFALEVFGCGTVVDACAGIGALSFADEVMEMGERKSLVKRICIECNPDFVRVGKRILPDAEWICANAFKWEVWEKIGKVDEVVSNPPFVQIDPIGFVPELQAGRKSVYLMAEIAMRAAKQATFIVDQQSCPFKVSGVDFMKLVDNKEYNKFHNRTGISFEPTSINTSPSLNDWVGVKTQVEIVTVSQRRYA